MDLGERINPFRISHIPSVPLNVESLSDARTPLAGFVNSLLGIISAFGRQWDRCQTLVETVKLFSRKGFIL